MNELYAAFDRALANPEEAQRKTLARILAHNAACAYGRDHGLGDAQDYEAFAARVPIASYETIEPYVNRVLEGEERVLVTEPVVYLATSSGTTGRKKYVLIEPSFFDETVSWMALERRYLEAAHPEIADRPELRYVNRVEGSLDRASGATLPIGAVSAWYYGEEVKRGQYAELVPFDVYQIASVTARNYAVLRFAITQDFARLSAVNPSTLLLVAQRLEIEGPQLVRDVRDGGVSHPELDAALCTSLRTRLPPDPARAKELETILARDGKLTPPAVWPSLKILCCWINAGAGLYRGDLGATFGPIPVWDYGYTSSEGRVTVTVDDRGAGVPLLNSVFLELKRESGVVPLFAAQDGDEGELLVTNSRGLYRYGMGDLVSIVGRMGKAPLLQFRRKTSAVASLTGEKLTEEQVGRVVEEMLVARGLRARFFCLLPEWGQPPRYILLLELSSGTAEPGMLVDLARALEKGLIDANAEYDKKRETLRLRAPAVQLLPPGAYDAYIAAQVKQGREAARIKTPRVTMDVALLAQFPPGPRGEV
jgi:GH3 auxin-responsive promoter